jgi:hypothetical protein
MDTEDCKRMLEQAKAVLAPREEDMILNMKCFVTQQPESCGLFSGRYACSC